MEQIKQIFRTISGSSMGSFGGGGSDSFAGSGLFSSDNFGQLCTAAAVTLAAVMSWLQLRLGVFGILFIITAAAMLLDLITRIYAAWVSESEKVESARIASGIKKKLGLCLLIVIGLLLDIGLEAVAETMGLELGLDIVFSALIMAWILIQELISNLENLRDAGIKMPDLLLRAMQTAADKLAAEAISTQPQAMAAAEKTAETAKAADSAQPQAMKTAAQAASSAEAAAEKQQQKQAAEAISTQPQAMAAAAKTANTSNAANKAAAVQPHIMAATAKAAAAAKSADSSKPAGS